MSHFSVLVVTDNPDQVEAALQPFHEYECTGTHDEYVVFVDHHDEIIKEWENDTSKAYRAPNGKIYDGYEDIFYREPTVKERDIVGMGSGCGSGISWTSKDWGDGRGYRTKVHFIPAGFEEFDRPINEQYETMEEYASDWHGYNIIENGRIGTYTNPNAKWDWWKIGGRYSNRLTLKNGEKVNQARKRDIDFVTPRKDSEEKAKKLYENVHKIIAGRKFKTWDEMRKLHDKIDDARTAYHEQDVVREVKAIHDEWWFSVDNFAVPIEEYVHKEGIAAIRTFAVLIDGKWLQRGEMGWWACVSDENDNWDNDFLKIIDNIEDDKFLTVVDCHI